MHSSRPSSSYRCGVYLVDLRSGEVSKNGTRIRLQEKPLRVLAALMERPGEVVTREELHRRLWPDTTFVDFEVGLNTAVKKLRVALCDDAEEPRYIETIPRRGYRFICAVEVVENRNGERESLADAAEVVPIPPPPAVQRPSDSVRVANRIWARVAITLLLLLAAFALWWQTPLAEPKALQIFPITDSAKLDFLVRPATDGARIFYLQRSGDHYDLMQASVTGGDVQKMQAPFRNTVIWDVSPDGSHYLIASLTRGGGPSQLWSWPVTGGAPVKLGDMISGSATYSPDGKQIAFHIDNQLQVGKADGSNTRILGTFKGDVDDPAWAPSGDRLRFTLKDGQQNSTSIWEIGLDGSGLHQILPHWTDPSRVCCGTWTSDGRYFVFVDTREKPRLWALREKQDWLRRSPAGPFLLVAEAEGSWSPLAGRAGNHIYFYSTKFQTELESLDVATMQFNVLLPGLHALMPGFSADGQWVAFVRTGSLSLWRSRIDGSDLHELPFAGMRVAFPRWSPDGKTLAFTAQGEGTAANAFMVDGEGGQPTPLAPGHENLGDPDWAPDGLTLVVRAPLDQPTSDADTQLALVSWRDRKLQEIPGSIGMTQPRWSPDGRWIAAVTEDRHELRVLEVRSNRWRTAARGRGLSLPVWSPDSANLYFQALGETGEPLRRVEVSSTQVETVTDFQKVLDMGVSRCVFIALTPYGQPIINFERSADIHGATLSLP